MMQSFASLTRDEQRALTVIVNRAHSLLLHMGQQGASKLSLRMDIAAVHAVTHLRLEELSRCQTFDFAHDITGIRKHIDRSTGRLKGFVPLHSNVIEDE